jgi:hypothetical protein
MVGPVLVPPTPQGSFPSSENCQEWLSLSSRIQCSYRVYVVTRFWVSKEQQYVNLEQICSRFWIYP